MKRLVALFIIMISTAVAAVTGERERGTAAQGDETYQIESLRSLGGKFNRGNSINDLGVVAGFTDVADGTARHATVWFHGYRQNSKTRSAGRTATSRGRSRTMAA